MPAVVAHAVPGRAAAPGRDGHEVALHGWIHERNTLLAEADERALLQKSIDTLEAITGVRPRGIRTPSWDFSPHTLALAREFGLLYDSSLMADDDPYELLLDGAPTGIVELPVEWIRDDAVYFNMNRFSGLRPYTPPSAVFEIFKAEFDAAWEDAGLFLLTMHPHHIGHRSRLPVLARLIDHMRAQGDVWFATHGEIAEYCLGEGVLKGD